MVVSEIQTYQYMHVKYIFRNQETRSLFFSIKDW